MWIFKGSPDYGRELSNVDLDVYVDDHTYTIVYKINGQVREVGEGNGMSNALRDLADSIDTP